MEAAAGARRMNSPSVPPVSELVPRLQPRRFLHLGRAVLSLPTLTRLSEEACIDPAVGSSRRSVRGALSTRAVASASSLVGSL